jgi:hypothetical protein
MRNTRTTFLVSLVIVILIAIGDLSARDTLAPLELVASTPKEELKNPYLDSSSAAEEAHKIYMSLDCSSCHGGGVLSNIFIAVALLA